MFDDDRARTVAALNHIAPLSAQILLPGHGRAHFGPVSDAVAIAGGQVQR
jgi:hypothetical protein